MYKSITCQASARYDIYLVSSRIAYVCLSGGKHVRTYDVPIICVLVNQEGRKEGRCPLMFGPVDAAYRFIASSIYIINIQ